jgi:glycosyltransferase involved in cell wall biosynthesis
MTMNQTDSNIRIAHIATVYQSLSVLLHDQMAATQRAGYEVIGISSPPFPADTRKLAAEEFHPVAMQRSIAPVADLISLWRLFRLFRRERFDVVHTHTPKAGLLGRLAARAAGVPIVCHTVHGFHFHSLMPRWLQRFYILIEKIASSCCDRVLSQNREDLETAVRERIVPADRIGLLGNGIDVKTFDRARLDAAEIQRKRSELGLREGVPVVGFVGRLAARRKGFTDFLKAAQQVAEMVPDVRFLIVGQPDKGKSDAVSGDLAEEFGIAERCLFLGHRPLNELPLLYAQMNLIALPSLFEGLPRAILEGAAMGVPAVATEVKGNREAVRHGETGFLVPHADVDALTDSMVTLLRNPDLAADMGTAARRFAEDRFDERKVIDRLLEEYSRLLRNQRRELQVAA